MLFSYIYNSLYKGYVEMGEKHIPGFYAVGLITLLQWLPCYSVLTILFKLKYIEHTIDKTTGIASVLILLAVNSLFFLPKSRHDRTIKKIAKLERKKIQLLRAIAIIYSLATIWLLAWFLML